MYVLREIYLTWCMATIELSFVFGTKTQTKNLLGEEPATELTTSTRRKTVTTGAPEEVHLAGRSDVELQENGEDDSPTAGDYSAMDEDDGLEDPGGETI